MKVEEVFLDELGRSERFGLGASASPDTPLARGTLLDVVSHVPPPPLGRTDIYLSKLAEATLVLELRDSITDTVMFRAVDRRVAEQAPALGTGFWISSDPVTNATDVRRLVRNWASLLRRRLDTYSEQLNRPPSGG